MLPSQRSFEEIARDLSVAHSTVKTHVRAIYSKLGVGSRRDAVDTARRHGLLRPETPWAPSSSPGDEARRRPEPESPRNGGARPVLR